MSELIGRTLGAYRIVEQLGMGGMATVYKGYQQNMDRNVAVKVLPRHFAQDPTFVGRFEQEAKVIARLEHARILPVYDYGQDDGVTYIVMRYLEGGTLSERIQAGRIPLEETARIIGQVSEGLDYAHKKGVIHRDIKPSNIMLDGNGDAYITDFGISKLVEGTAQFTGSGIVGTPDYVSPEQALGQPLDTRSDIYSLGIVLYQMVTNDVPFHAETPMAVIIKHIHEPLPPPRSLAPDLPESVENVILKALAKNPQDRYQTCGELARTLNAALGGTPVPAPDLTPSRMPTSLPNSTRPVAGFGEPGTMPMAPPPGASQPTRAAKKSSPWLAIALVVGALVVISVIAAVILGGLKNARDRKAGATETAAAALAGQPTKVQVSSATQAATPKAGATQSGPNAIFSDHFADATLKSAWRWVNQPSQDQWSLDGGQLALPVLPQTAVADVTDGSGKITAPVLMIPLPSGAGQAYAVLADVTIAPSADGQAAGLVVLDDSQRPWFDLLREDCADPAPACSGDAVYFDDWREYVLARASYHPKQAGGGKLPSGGPVTLRLVVQAHSISADYSLDAGKTWSKVGDWAILRGAQIGFIGLVTSSGGKAAPAATAHFDNFAVTSPNGQ